MTLPASAACTLRRIHYRIQRIEHFTGRDLSRLCDRLDLWAALLCR
ncbi:helix-turn-helix domain-containing protein [Streptomyces sp. NPDC058249]